MKRSKPRDLKWTDDEIERFKSKNVPAYTPIKWITKKEAKKIWPKKPKK